MGNLDISDFFRGDGMYHFKPETTIMASLKPVKKKPGE